MQQYIQDFLDGKLKLTDKQAIRALQTYAAERVKKLGIFKNPDPDRVSIVYQGSWKSCVVYSDHDNTSIVYSFKKDCCLTSFPIVITTTLDVNVKDYHHVYRFKYYDRTLNMDMHNVLTPDGVAFNVFYQYLSKLCTPNGDFVVKPEGDDYYRLRNINGNFSLPDEFLDITFIYTNLIQCETEHGKYTIYDDKTLTPVLEGIDSIETLNINYIKKYPNYDYYSNTIKLYKVDSDGTTKIYNEKMNLICDNFLTVSQVYSSNFERYILESHHAKWNIIGKNGKPMFGSSLNDRQWLDKEPMIDYITIVQRQNKYNFVCIDTLDLMLDEWADAVNEISLDFYDIYDAVAVKIGNKCNIMIMNKTDQFGKWMFNEPVDGISMYKDFLIAEKDGKNYICFGKNDTRLLEIPFNQIEETDEAGVYVIYNDDGVDYISIHENESICEKLFNGKKFDEAYDVTSLFPVVSMNGKYNYFSCEDFDIVIEDPNTKKPIWFDGAELAEYDKNDDKTIFTVNDNGKIRKFTNYYDMIEELPVDVNEQFNPVASMQINEDDKVKEAYLAVVESQLLDNPDIDNIVLIDQDVWNHAYVKDSNNRSGVIYSFEKKQIITPEPIEYLHVIYKYNKDESIFIVNKRINSNKIVENILTKDGLAWNEWCYDINVKAGHFNDNFIISKNEKSGYIIKNINGDVIEQKEYKNIYFIGNKGYYVCDDGKAYSCHKYDGSIVFSGANGIKKETVCWHTNYNQPDDKFLHKDIFLVDYNYNVSKIDIYDQDFNILIQDVKYCSEIYPAYGDNALLEVTSQSGKINIIGKDCKLLFDTKNGSDYDANWAEPSVVGDSLYSILKTSTGYYIVSNAEKIFAFDEPFDDAKYIYLNYINDSGIALRKNNKCNILITDKSSRLSHQEKLLFDEWVDAVKKYKQFFIAVKNGKDYLIWNNGKLINVDFDKIEKTDRTYMYVIYGEEGFDWIEAGNDQTLCEKINNDVRFKEAYDITSLFPIVEKNGKYTYLNIDLMDFAIKNTRNRVLWFDDVELSEQVGNNHYVFNVKDGDKIRSFELNDKKISERKQNTNEHFKSFISMKLNENADLPDSTIDDMIESACEKVKEIGIITDPSVSRSVWIGNYAGWNSVVVVRSKSSSNKIFYSLSKDEIISGEAIKDYVPVKVNNELYVFIVSSMKNGKNVKYNILKPDGFASKKWFDQISDQCTKNGDFIVKYGSSVNIMDLDGIFPLEETTNMGYFKDAKFLKNGNILLLDGELHYIVDQNLKEVLHEFTIVSKPNLDYFTDYDKTEDIGNAKHFTVNVCSHYGGLTYSLLDDDYNIISLYFHNFWFENYSFSSNFSILVIERNNKKNIVGRDSKLLILTNKTDTSEWADDIEFDVSHERFGIITKENKKCIFDPLTLTIINDSWYDDVALCYSKLTPLWQNFAVKDNGKCNIIGAFPGKEKYDYVGNVLLDEWADDICVYNMFVIITYGDKHKLFLPCGRLLDIQFGQIEETTVFNVYVIYNDDGFDWIRLRDNKTLCELINGGERFKEAYDITSCVPIVGNGNKYTYIDIKNKRFPLVDDKGNPLYCDDIEIAQHAGFNEVMLNYTINGEIEKVKYHF